ncbi:MAG: cytochrome c oxidase accessory protein CcoG [Cyclobacteriaceae bacterium]|nr:cytochrome c oxidase accessory protein CcoG [Cyclobacteriaceae bacterium]
MEEREHLYEEESFRDQLSTLDERGNRKWIYPKKPSGNYYKARIWVSYFLLTVLIGGPFVRLGGEPLLLLNIIERRFVILGQVFWPQDSYLFAIGLITIVVMIVLFTVIYGRIFCGWICPQTIFMEMVFRRIEYAIEGDYQAQKKLDSSPWTADKILKKGSKHVLFIIISILIMHTFMAYFIGTERLGEIISSSPVENLGGFFAMLFFTGMFYFIFSKFREQACTNVCPYGRLQGVLLDKNSVVVAYDSLRGEKREKVRKGEDRKNSGKGDCIDCKQCVYVCPTGIDIRNGTQLECVNCTACMDACDSIMDKVGLERGLIRYASQEEIETKSPFRFTARMMAYSGFLLLLLGVLGTLLVVRSDVETTILRTPGVMYQDQGEGKLSNLYNFKVINKTNHDIPVSFRMIGEKGTIRLVGEKTEFNVEKQGTAEGALFIFMEKEQLDGVKTRLSIGIYSGDALIETVTTTFMGPVF